MVIEVLALLVLGDAPAIDALLAHHQVEALTNLNRAGCRTMTVVGFLLIMLIVIGGLAVTGHAPDIPLPAILSLIGIFAFLFSAGVYIAATLAILGLLAGFISRPARFGCSSVPSPGIPVPTTC